MDLWQTEHTALCHTA